MKPAQVAMVVAVGVALTVGCGSAAPTASTGVLTSRAALPPRTLGLWLAPAEIARLPMSGSAWQSLKARADGPWGTLTVADQNSRGDIDTLAGALVYARTRDPEYRDKVLKALDAVIGTDADRDPHCKAEPNMARSLAIGRNLAAYIIAADIVGARADGDETSVGSRFQKWIEEVRFKKNCPNALGPPLNLSEVHDNSGSNASAMAGGARIAAALYLGDKAEVDSAWETYHRYSGDRTKCLTACHFDEHFSEDALTWAADPNAPVPVNPPGATKDGFRIDGAIIADDSRGGPWRWPPKPSPYVEEGEQGYFVQAELLYRAGFPSYEVTANAPLRTLHFNEYVAQQTGDVDDWWSEGDWVKWLAQFRYEHTFSLPFGPASGGSPMAWTDWSHGPRRTLDLRSKTPGIAPLPLTPVGQPTPPPVPLRKLVGRVGPGAAISLKTPGSKPVKQLLAGPVEIRVVDRTSRDNFHLVGPGVNRKTGVPGMGKRVWRMQVKPGTYRYFSDAHPLKGSFVVKQPPRAGTGSGK